VAPRRNVRELRIEGIHAALRSGPYEGEPAVTNSELKPVYESMLEISREISTPATQCASSYRYRTCNFALALIGGDIGLLVRLCGLAVMVYAGFGLVSTGDSGIVPM